MREIIIEDIPMYIPLQINCTEKTKIKEIEVIGNIYDNKELLGE